MVISRTIALRPGVYQLPAPGPADSAVIVVRGSDIVVDMRGVELRGAAVDDDPDRARGVAILVDGGANVTIRNARIRGYKVAIHARGTHNLQLVNNDLSFNWKPRLYSIVEHESLADWLSFHHNEKDEWLRYGAAIYLSDVRGGEIRGNTVVQGMNALLITRSDSLLVRNNDFSFNSGLGIGLYRSDHNRVVHNRVEYDVRGYSEGFYRRGQDSAGILLYEQCDSNTVAFNSVTHGGDGLFIWAGQHTMDTGLGGVNDNLILGNDFSWAPTNAMEATFSRNAFVNNIARGSDYGLWGGYSFESTVLFNDFRGNRNGIAIEHGQNNRIVGNLFTLDSTDIALWADSIQPSDWGYPQHRDTRSRDYEISENTMRGARVGFRIRNTTNAVIRDNIVRADSVLVLGGDTTGFVFAGSARRDSVTMGDQRWVTGRRTSELLRRYRLRGMGASVLPGAYADWPRSTIIVDEWGPYDWTYPKLWPVDSSLSTPLALRVLGPVGMPPWRVWSITGAVPSKGRGIRGDTIVVTPNPGRIEDWTITLDVGGRLVSYSRFDPKAVWDVKLFSWSDSTHPVNAPAAFASLIGGKKGAPVLTLASRRLDYVWFRPRVEGWPLERVGAVATTDVDLPAGTYTLRTIGDDGIRVFVDERVVIDDWTVHESRVIAAPLAAGRHRIRVEYFQVDGWTELRAEIVKAAR